MTVTAAMGFASETHPAIATRRHPGERLDPDWSHIRLLIVIPAKAGTQVALRQRALGAQDQDGFQLLLE